MRLAPMTPRVPPTERSQSAARALPERCQSEVSERVCHLGERVGVVDRVERRGVHAAVRDALRHEPPQRARAERREGGVVRGHDLASRTRVREK